MGVVKNGPPLDLAFERYLYFAECMITMVHPGTMKKIFSFKHDRVITLTVCIIV